MDPLPSPLAFFLLLFSGWINRQQQGVIDYLREENRVLRSAYGPRRVRLTDDQRRRLAAKGKPSADDASPTSPASSRPIRSGAGTACWSPSWDGLAAADFFTVEVLTWRGLVRYVVFFAMELKTRTVAVAGITSQPHERWMTQIARNLTDAHDGFLRDTHDLILDREPLYSAAFRGLLQDRGVNLVRLPVRSPNLNAFAERVVGSVRAECFARMVPIGEGHLRAAVRAFIDHYHEERPHQGLGNALLAPNTSTVGQGSVRCRERLGGLLKFYYRAAA